MELESGEKLECDDVVINADFGHAVSTLFDKGQLRKYTPARLAKKNWSCSNFMMYLGLDRAYPEAEHHMIVFAKNYRGIPKISRTNLRRYLHLCTEFGRYRPEHRPAWTFRPLHSCAGS